MRRVRLSNIENPQEFSFLKASQTLPGDAATAASTASASAAAAAAGADADAAGNIGSRCDFFCFFKCVDF